MTSLDVGGESPESQYGGPSLDTGTVHVRFMVDEVAL